MRKTFPNIKPIQEEYKANSRKLRLKGSGTDSSIIGAGIDVGYRIMLDEDYIPEQLYWFFPYNERYQKAVVFLAYLAGAAKNSDLRKRAIWSLGYIDNHFRAGSETAYELSEMVRDEKFDASWLLFKPSDRVLKEIDSLWYLGIDHLKRKVSGPFQFAPTFDLSAPGDNQRIAAEADFVANHSLIEIKTVLGEKRADGTYYDTLPGASLYQLIAYALLDYSNAYEIEKLGLYSSRYARLHEWPLEQVVSTAADDSFDLAEGRQFVFDLMQREHDWM